MLFICLDKNTNDFFFPESLIGTFKGEKTEELIPSLTLVGKQQVKMPEAPQHQLFQKEH